MTKVVMDKQVLMVEVVMLVVTAKVAMIRVGMVMQDTVEGTHMVCILIKTCIPRDDATL